MGGGVWWCVTRVAQRAALNKSRSAMSMCSTARIASRFSVIDTGRPALRSSWTNPWRTSSIGSGAVAGGHQLLAGLGDVRLVLEENVEGVADDLGGDLRRSEEEERAGPVDGLGDRRGLLQLELAGRADHPGDLLGELVVALGDPDPHDVRLAFEVRGVDVQVQAASLQRLGELAGVVGGEDDEGA